MENKFFKTKFGGNTRVKLEVLIESLIYEILYPKLFNKDEEDKKARNDQLKEKFYVLQNMINFDILEIPKNLRLPSLYSMCQYDLRKINDYKSPVAKLNIFSNCAHYLIDVYYHSEKRLPNQDELFPLLVYLVLYSNPDHFQTNIDFISNYLRKVLMMGEYGFLLTSLNAIMLFLDGLEGSSLMEGKLEVKSSKRNMV